MRQLCGELHRIEERSEPEARVGIELLIDRLRASITELEQQNLDLRLQLDEKDEELSAARAANREPTKTINQGRS